MHSEAGIYAAVILKNPLYCLHWFCYQTTLERLSLGTSVIGLWRKQVHVVFQGMLDNGPHVELYALENSVLYCGFRFHSHLLCVRHVLTWNVCHQLLSILSRHCYQPLFFMADQLVALTELTITGCWAREHAHAACFQGVVCFERPMVSFENCFWSGFGFVH